MATIVLSSALVPYAKHRDKIEVSGKTLFSLFFNMIQNFPKLRHYLFDATGNLTTAMNFYLNETSFPKKGWQNVPVYSSDVISILLSDRNKFEKCKVMSLQRGVSTIENTANRKHLRIVNANPASAASFYLLSNNSKIR